LKNLLPWICDRFAVEINPELSVTKLSLLPATIILAVAVPGKEEIIENKL